MGLKLEELYKMSVEDAVNKLKLADIKIHNNGDSVVAIELRYEDKNITQATMSVEDNKKGRLKW